MSTTMSATMPVAECAKAVSPEKALLGIAAEAFAANFDKKPFVIKHDLCSHSLFDLDRLMRLAQSLPGTSVEYNAGAVPINCDPNETPMTGLSAAETIRRIEECKSWMVLKNVEQDPAYNALLAGCLEEVKAYSEAIAPGMSKPEAFIFLTSPGSVTPYHMDPEHNFLLQIRGNKFMTVFDRGLVSAEELERFHQGAHRNLSYCEDYLERSTTFELLPGDGLHVPVAAPHYVRNGSGVSVSFSITFRTPDLERKALAHRVNGQLRARGLHPRAVGESVSRDALKAMTFRVLRKSRALLGTEA